MSSFVHRGSGPQQGKKVIRDTGRPQQKRMPMSDEQKQKKVRLMMRMADGLRTAIGLLKEADTRSKYQALGYDHATKVIRIAGRDSLVTVNDPLLRSDPNDFPPDDELVPPPTDGERDAAREVGMTVAEMRASNAAISQARADQEEETAEDEPTPAEMNALRQSLKPEQDQPTGEEWMKQQIAQQPLDAEGLSEAIERPQPQPSAQPASGTQTEEAAAQAAARANEAVRAKKNATDYATMRLASNYVPSAEALRRIIEG